MSESAVQRHLYQYGPSQGQITELVGRALLRDYGVNVPPQSIVMTVGGGPTLLGLPAFGLLGFVGATLGALWLLFGGRK